MSENPHKSGNPPSSFQILTYCAAGLAWLALLAVAWLAAGLASPIMEWLAK